MGIWEFCHISISNFSPYTNIRKQYKKLCVAPEKHKNYLLAHLSCTVNVVLGTGTTWLWVWVWVRVRDHGYGYGYAISYPGTGTGMGMDTGTTSLGRKGFPLLGIFLEKQAKKTKKNVGSVKKLDQCLTLIYPTPCISFLLERWDIHLLTSIS